MAHERLEQLDISAAIEGILYFVRDPEVIKRTWSKAFFQQLLHQIQIDPKTE